MNVLVVFFATILVATATFISVNFNVNGQTWYVSPIMKDMAPIGSLSSDPFIFELDDTGAISYTNSLGAKVYWNYASSSIGYIYFSSLPFKVPFGYNTFSGYSFWLCAANAASTSATSVVTTPLQTSPYNGCQLGYMFYELVTITTSSSTTSSSTTSSTTASTTTSRGVCRQADVQFV